MRLRALALVVAALVAAVGCAVDEDDAALEGEQPPPGETTTAPGAVPGSGSENGDGGGAAPPSPPAPGSSPPPPAPTPAPSAPATGPPGSFAPALLRPEAGVELVLELLVQDGAEPSSAAIDHVRTNLRRESGKPVSTASGVVRGDDRSWTADELLAAADSASGRSQGGGTVVLRLLFVRGSFHGNDQALGIAVRGDVAAIFTDRVAQARGGSLLGGDRLERAVALHEVGHLLGLVDLYLETGRADPEHPGHSRNDESVMYWAVESSLVTELLTGGVPTEFDAADRQDLARIRAGG